MKTRIIAYLAAAACVWGSCFPVLAAESTRPYAGGANASGTIQSHAVDGAAYPVPATARELIDRGLYFLYFDTITAAISESKGVATCTATVLAFPEYNTKLSMVLQYSTDGKKWKDLKSWSLAASSGKERIVLEREYALPYTRSQYRVVSKVSVNTGEHIETADCASNTVYY